MGATAAVALGEVLRLGFQRQFALLDFYDFWYFSYPFASSFYKNDLQFGYSNVTSPRVVTLRNFSEERLRSLTLSFAFGFFWRQYQHGEVFTETKNGSEAES